VTHVILQLLWKLCSSYASAIIVRRKWKLGIKRAFR
jgi:hypothetical protein